MAIEGTGSGYLPVQSQGDQPFASRPAAFPFSPFQAAQFPAYPLVQFFKHSARLRHTEVARPAAQQRFQSFKEDPQVAASSFPELLPQFVFEPFHALWAQLAPGFPSPPSVKSSGTFFSMVVPPRS